MARKFTTHKQRMALLDMHAKGMPVSEVAKVTGTDTTTIRFIFKRIVELVWDIEGWKGSPPNIKTLKKMGMWENVIILAHRHESEIAHRYGKRKSTLAREAKAASANTGRIVWKEMPRRNFWQRIGDWFRYAA